MADFELAVRKTLGKEGVRFDADGDPVVNGTGYTFNPADPGGETNYGVTKNTAVAAGYLGDMIDIPFFWVRKIYRASYWDALHGDDIPDQEIAEEVFDIAVNMGVHQAGLFLQRTLNVLNNRGTKYPDVKADGAVGPATIAALTAALAISPWYRMVILRAIDALRAVRYIELAEANPKLEAFAPGWIRNRVGALDA